MEKKEEENLSERQIKNEIERLVSKDKSKCNFIVREKIQVFPRIHTFYSYFATDKGETLEYS